MSDEQTVTLKKVRLSFPSLREPTASITNGAKKFRGAFIIDPNAPEGAANLAACQAAVAAAELAEFKKNEVLKHIRDPKRLCMREGKDFVNAEGEIYNGYEGMVGVTTTANKRPVLLDRKKNRVEPEDIEDIFYGGVFVDAQIRFYCVSSKEKGGNGLFASVNAIRSHQEGESFGGVSVDVDAFDDLEDIEEDDGFSEPAGSSAGSMFG